MFYRVAVEALLASGTDSNTLLPNQLGVRSPGGTEPIIQLVEMRLLRIGADDDMSSLDIDINNAFNTVDRVCVSKSVQKHNPELSRFYHWSYGSASSILVYTASGEVVILESSQGVRQGDPAGTTLFSLTFRPVLERIEAKWRETKIPFQSFAYLDDLKCIVASSEADHFLQLAMEVINSGPERLTVNIAKSGVCSSQTVQSTGIEVLGSFVGPLHGRRAFLEGKLEKMQREINKLNQLPRQGALLLLRQCITPSLRHLLRCLDSSGIEDLWKQADNMVFAELRRLRNSEDPSQRDPEIDRILGMLPMRFGGLGLGSYAESTASARIASMELSERVLDAVANERPIDLEDLPTQRQMMAETWSGHHTELLSMLDEPNQMVVADNASSMGHAWLRAIPLYPHLILSDRDVIVGLHTRTLVPGPREGTCVGCGQTAGPSHDLTCRKRGAMRTARHEIVKKCLATALMATGAQVRLEPFSIQPHSGRRADIEVTGPVAPNGSRAALDVSIVAVASNGSQAAAVAIPQDNSGHTSIATLARQRVSAALEARFQQKIADASSENFGSEFVPIVLSSAGTTHPKLELLFGKLKEAGCKLGALKFQISCDLLRARAVTFSF